MPVSIKEIEPKKPVPIAQTPEFKKLQDLIDTAKVSLDDVARQIVVVESKLMLTLGKPGEDAMARAQAAQSTSSYDGVSNPGDAGNDSISPMQGVTGTQGTTGQTFEQSIAEMQRIAGLR
jgi:hypothetical protein